MEVMKKTSFIFALVLFCSFTYGQHIITQPSEVRSTDSNTTLVDNILDGYVANQKANENTLSLEDSAGNYQYVLTYEPLYDYDVSDGNMRKYYPPPSNVAPEYAKSFYNTFSGERNVYLYQIDMEGNYVEATKPIYTDYVDGNSYKEIFTYTIWKNDNDGLATSYVWRIKNDLIVMFVKRHFQVADYSSNYNHQLFMYNDIVFFKETEKGFYEHTVYSPENVYTTKPELTPKVHQFKNNLLTFEMVDGEVYEFAVSEKNEVLYLGSKLKKNESSIIYTDNGN